MCGRTIVGLQAVQQGLIRWARTLAIVVSIAAAGLIFFLGVFKSNRAQLLPALSQSGSIQASVLIEVISMSFEARRIAKMKKNPGD